MTPALVALMNSQRRLIEHLEKLEPQLGDDPTGWQLYSALAAIAPQLRPEVIAPLLTR
jgi:hypothetical protein